MRALFILFFATLATCIRTPPNLISRAGGLLDEYDYIIVGGGTAGLVVGERLSEDPATSVLVVEAGPIIDGDYELNSLLIPGEVFAQTSTTGQMFDWNITGEPDAELGGRTTAALSRKIVGGASSSNAMFFDRGSRRDYNNWADWTGDKGWGFDGLLPYFKKLETFTPPPKEIAEEYDIKWDPNVHGTDGPVSSSYPPWMWKSIKPLRAAIIGLGVSVPEDGAGGNAVGAIWVPSSIRSSDWTRSYAKKAYHEKAADRQNYHLITENTVTKIIFDQNVAVGVEYAAGPSIKKRETVKAKREVILSAGAIHSPKLLQLSGVGDKRLLNDLKIPMIVDLPGVGQNHQDHPAISLTYTQTWPPWADVTTVLFNATAAQEARDLYIAKQEGPYTSPVGNFAAKIAFSIASPRYKKLISDALITDPAKYLPADTHPTVVAGYRKQVKLILSSLATNSVAAYEQSYTSATLQHPLSRGYIKINSSNPFDLPLVSWRTLSHPFDADSTLDAIDFVRRIYDRPELAVANPVETAPGRNITAEADLIKYIKDTMTPSWHHHTGTCQIGKRSLGGVVNTNLQVHGVKNLRVVDASVFPLLVGAHLSNTVYAVAERAVDVIRQKAQGF